MDVYVVGQRGRKGKIGGDPQRKILPLKGPQDKHF